MDIECGADGCDDSIESCHPIRIPHDDPVFHNEKCLEFVRSEGIPDLDCSMGIYASAEKNVHMFFLINLSFTEAIGRILPLSWARAKKR